MGAALRRRAATLQQGFASSHLASAALWVRPRRACALAGAPVRSVAARRAHAARIAAVLRGSRRTTADPNSRAAPPNAGTAQRPCARVARAHAGLHSALTTGYNSGPLHCATRLPEPQPMPEQQTLTWRRNARARPRFRGRKAP